MAEKIGLEAVLQLNSFQSAVKTYNQAISGMSKNTASTASSISSSFVSLGSGILKVGAIAAGAGLVGITALTGGLLLLGSTALTEFAKYERMALSIQSLVARELSQGQLVEQQRTVAISLTKKEAQELEGLAGKIHEEELARDTLHARIKEQSEALRQLRDAHGNEALDVQTATARLAQLENQYNKSGAEIQTYKDRQIELSNKTGEYTTVLEKVRTGQISMTDAMAQAGPKAQELLNWISKLAVESPFTQEGVQQAFQTALAYGFTTEKAKELTEAELDFAAATGKGVEVTNLIALALGQIQAKGKVSGQELIQLTNAGVGVNAILESMGFTLDDVSNGLVDADIFIQAVIDDMNVFKGAGKAQAQTFSGLISTLSDLKAIGLREFFTGTFVAIQPYLADFVNGLTSAALETGSIRALGDAFGTYVATGLQEVITTVTKLSSAFSKFGIRGAAVSFLGQLGLDKASVSQVTSVIDIITTSLGKISQAYARFGIEGATTSILGQLGLDPQVLGNIKTTISGIVSTVTDGFNQIKSAYDIFGVQGAGFTLLKVLGISPETLIFLDKNLTSIIDTLTEKFNAIKGAFDTFGVRGAAFSIAGMLGIDSDTMVMINNVISSLGSAELIGAITGIGAALAALAAGSVIATIVAGLSSILTPLTLITVGMGTLFAAWQGNWGGIQQIATQVSSVLISTFNSIIAVIMGIVNAFATTAWPQLQQAFSNLTQALSNLGLNWGDVFSALATSTGIVIGGIIAIIGGLANAFATSINTATQILSSFTSGINNILTGITQSFVGFGQLIQGILAADLDKIGQGLILLSQSIVSIIQGLAESTLAVISAPFALLLANVRGFVSGAIAVFQGLYNAVVGNSIIPDMVNDIVKWFKDMPQKILTGMGDLVGKISAPFEDVWEAVKDAINIDEWMQLGTDAINGLLEGMKAKAGDVLEFLKNLAMDSLTGLGQWWGAQSPARKFIPLGESVPQGLTVGINKAAPGFNSALNDLGQSAINSLMTGMTVTDPSFIHNFIDDLNMGGIGKAAGAGGGQWRNFRNILINEITAGMSGLEAGTINFMDKITEVANRFQFPPNLAREFAEAEGLVDHLTGTFSVMFQKLRIENLSTSVGLASQFAGIGESFSGMIKEQVEAFDKFKEGAVELVGENAKLTESTSTQEIQLAKLRAELAKLTTGAGSNALSIEKITESLAFGERQLEIYQTELAKLSEGSLEWDKKKLAIDRLTESMDMQQKQLEKLTAASNIDLISVQKKQQEIAKLTEEINKNKESLIKNEQALANYRKELEKKAFQGSNPFATEDEKLQSDLAAIELLQDFLKSSGKELRIVGEELGGVFAGSGLTSDIVYSRVQAQKELNRLLAEEAQRQQEILNIEKAQKQLDFLNNQINLLKMLSDRGLNPRQILGGIKLGIDASASDLLAATNRVVQAMVNQINSDLQIASPSKVMARIGGQVVAGMAQGIERGRMMLTDTVRNIPLLNGSIPQPVFSQQGGMSSSVQNTYNYNMPMTVNTAASASGVIRQYEVKRSMYAN